ncbi:MAG TPA: TolC family protein [Pirellulales bacterium]|jgi:outer membrane protein TolC|nr:TolC family protein [Pirellulales bacterium]
MKLVHLQFGRRHRDRGAARIRRFFVLLSLIGMIGFSDGCATPDRDTAASTPLAKQIAPANQPGISSVAAQNVAGIDHGSGTPQAIGNLIQPNGLMSPFRLVGYAEDEEQPAVDATATPQSKYAPAALIAGASPIDLPTALQLVDADSPTVALARDRVREAYLQERQADLSWLPDLRTGPTYDRHDGRIQNTSGTITEVSRQSLFVGGGAELEWNTSELLFGRLAAQRLTAAAQADARAVSSNVQLDVAIAYLDLLQAYGEYAIYSDALARAEEMLRNAESAEKAGLSKTTADINRARTEVDLRRERQFQLQAQIAIVSARLARLLLLRPTTILKPNDSRVVPIGLIPDLSKLDELVSVGLSNRPELQQNRALVAAAMTRWRQAQVGPLIPHLGLAYAGGTFGGGVNEQMSDFGARSDGTAEAFWELHNMGAGEVIQSRLRQTQANEASLNLTDVQARVAEEVTSAAQSAQADQRSLESAEQAVVQALETWRRLSEASFGLAGAEHQYDPLQPLIALRDLADARTLYLGAVIDFNKSQFRLYWAMGQPPLGALPQMAPRPTNTPVVPELYSRPEEVPPPAKKQ